MKTDPELLRTIKEDDRVATARSSLFNKTHDVMAEHFPDLAWQLIVMFDYRNCGVRAVVGGGWDPALELAPSYYEPDILHPMLELGGQIHKSLEPVMQKAADNIGYDIHWKMVFSRATKAAGVESCRRAVVNSVTGEARALVPDAGTH